MKCSAQKKSRVSKHKKGNANSYKRGLKGHGWEGHGAERKCRKCGKFAEALK